MSRPATNDNALGAYLKDRRTRLDPAAFGIAGGRRRTPGLRREEVAQRANISVTWYTWLERGRGGPPSAAVLDRIASALMLTDAEREHLFLLALGRPPEVRYQETESISPRIQRVLDALVYSPAYVKTLTWDLVAWNHAAGVVFNYDELDPSQRNILRRIFCDPQVRDFQSDWDSVARLLVSVFRADAARAAATDAAASVAALVEELSRASPEFAMLWKTHDVRSFGEGTKQLLHPQGGPLVFEHSSFVIDGRPDLSMVIYSPATPADTDVVRSLIEKHQKASR
ncbi:transcriptional regulator with XRE-family HTH domain [Trinickia symbiotica]|uniref:Transcriptional regulator n=1 Tax=Trinickia symbiotica TaxID=863227 RepID=A0A2N7X4N5_9BURK|nr:helix-turn-helix transcriptional regulator [Trinickia symbiotica]PMS36570.1 transcriptional regulator [Trinickia symbiotica]PPK45978.1 transcriptional regulator with XRE-family HTH domain [Trinickia symbiotica]